MAERAHALFRVEKRTGNGRQLQIVPNAWIYVYEAGTTFTRLQATMYATKTGSEVLENPLRSDDDGSVEFYLDAGQRVTYVATEELGGPTVVTNDYEIHWNPADVALTVVIAGEFIAVNDPWIDLKSPTYGAKFDAQRVTDAAMTSGSPFVDSAAAFFTNLDVGKWINVQNAGDIQTHGGHVHQQIVARVSATRVQLDGNAGRTVSGALAQWGTDDTAAWNAALSALRAAGGGTLYAPKGNSLCLKALNFRALSYVNIFGAGRGRTQVWASALMDSGGADQNERSSFFNALNFTETVLVGPGPDGNFIWTGNEALYFRKFMLSKMTIDCTFQSTTGEPMVAVGGYSAAVVELQDVSDAWLEDLDIVGGWGNGVVFGSIDPRTYASLKNCLLRNVTFTNCVRGILPNYGITGSVIQFGAAKYCQMDHVQIINCGGPAWDLFNVDTFDMTDTFVEGWNGAPMGATQVGTICAGHSDFGATRLRVKNYTSINAGGIFLTGQMSNQFVFNGYTATPGPIECSFENVSIFGTAKISLTPPTLTSGVSTATVTGFPTIYELTIANGATVTVEMRTGGDGADATLVSGRTAAGVFRFVVPIGKRARVTWTGSPAPTVACYAAPNATAPAFSLNAGSVGGAPGSSVHNILKHVAITFPPADGIRLMDCSINTLQAVSIHEPGYYDGTQAYGVHLYGTLSLCSFNDIVGLYVLDSEPAATRRLKAAIYEDASNVGAVNNSIAGLRTTNGINGALVMANPNVPSLPAVTTPALPGASTPLTNPFTHNCLVSVTGATNVSVDGAFLGIATGWIFLPQGSSILYTGAPSWLWYRV